MMGTQRAVAALLIGALALVGCGGSSGTEGGEGVEDVATPDTVVTPTPTAVPTLPSRQGGPTPEDSKPALSSVDTPEEAPRTRPGLDGISDLSAAARPLPNIEAITDESIILLEDVFQTTTPSLESFESVDGSGGVGHFDDLRFFEIVLAEPQGYLARPFVRVPVDAAEALFAQSQMSALNVSGLTAIERGLYCWASNANDPLSGARYELLFSSTTGELRLVRHGADGSPEALLISETLDLDQANEGREGPVLGFDSTLRIAMLCRPDEEGRAQIAVGVQGQYHVTTDQDTHAPGGGAGVVVAGSGPHSPDTIVTVFNVFLLDGSRVPLG